MKKSFKSVAIMLMVVMFLMPNVSNAETKVNIVVNGNAVESNAFINEDNRTMVPISIIASELGYNVEWLPDAKVANIWNVENDISIQVGSNRAVINITSHYMDTEPVIVEGRTMVPLGIIATALGSQVEWDSATRTVIVTTDALEVSENIQEHAQTTETETSLDDMNEYERAEWIAQEQMRADAEMYEDFELSESDLAIYKQFEAEAEIYGNE